MVSAEGTEGLNTWYDYFYIRFKRDVISVEFVKTGYKLHSMRHEYLSSNFVESPVDQITKDVSTDHLHMLTISTILCRGGNFFLLSVLWLWYLH